MRIMAASARFAFVGGQVGDGFSGGNERHAHRARNCLPVLQAIGNQPQRQGLNGNSCLFLRPAVCGNAG
jgi:hypothetical protein